MMLQGYVRKDLGLWNEGITSVYYMARDESMKWHQVYPNKGVSKVWGKNPGWDQQVTEGLWVPYTPVVAQPKAPPLELNIAAKAHTPAETVWYKSGTRFKKAGDVEYMLARATSAGYQVWLVSTVTGNCWGGPLIPTKSPKECHYAPSVTKEEFEKAYGPNWNVVEQVKQAQLV